jgi:hypothetical protein
MGAAHDRLNPQTWNRYSYVYNNPLRYIDPYGQEATLTVDEENKKLLITANIDIWGKEATDDVAKQIESSIESEWSGQTYLDPQTGNKYSIEVDVTVRNVGTEKEKATGENRIKIDSMKDKADQRDWVSTFGRVDTGTWKPGSDSKTRAHEWGHLMGLADDYNSRSFQPNPGHRGHLMAGGVPRNEIKIAEHEVKDVVAKPVSTYDEKGKTVFRLH